MSRDKAAGPIMIGDFALAMIELKASRFPEKIANTLNTVNEVANGNDERMWLSLGKKSVVITKNGGDLICRFRATPGIAVQDGYIVIQEGALPESVWTALFACKYTGQPISKIIELPVSLSHQDQPESVIGRVSLINASSTPHLIIDWECAKQEWGEVWARMLQNAPAVT